MTSILETVDERGIATVTLNRPEQHNAFDDVLIADLTASLKRLEGDPGIRAVVLTGAGRSFSAGADLGWMRRMAQLSVEENIADAAGLAGLMHMLDRLCKPTLALVQGAAFGGGAGLVACCDIAIASDRASFCFSEVKLGLTPATISPYVINAIGPRWARRLFQTAEVFNADRARDIGLVQDVVPEGELTTAGEGVLKALLQGAPGAQADAKDLIFLCEGRALDAALAEETGRRIAARRASTEGREGTSAFLAKTTPAWRQQ
ncbi:enoyl-CoA hydratase-related protein (plasmid) [Rhizobium sp. 32-5/1]|uniref:enoyl-CoA hydratase-related protein n=1 Tax=Rhizobium sp. 32-5/1 TaxID=3019602 RepID=UPI00240DCCB5|nr:enoyl-CoA hydratase-related protein [Rhizobium sp. 32-5/1]WEZ85280.1 enoyl-CoA hydratase-related protein [Rhizobium sp. 32-5/1]